MKVQVFVNSGTGFAAIGQQVDLNAATFKAQAPEAREAWVCAQVEQALNPTLDGRKITRCTLTKVGAKVLLGKTDGSKGTVGIYITLGAAPVTVAAPVKVANPVRTQKRDLVGAQKALVTRVQHAKGISAAQAIALLGF